jgi:hypothetical protein
MSDTPTPTPTPDPEYLQETLFASSTIRLFGREFVGLEIGKLGLIPNSNAPLLTSLARDRNDIRLARIYGYSYQGNYYKLLEPTVFLVHGDGFPVTAGQDPIRLGIIGVEFKDEVFAKHVKMWPADQLDMAVRIDITVGWLQDILLDGVAAPANNVTASDISARAEAVGRAEAMGRAEAVTPSRRR